MDEIGEKIFRQYLHEVILKLQKTAQGLEKMIEETDPLQNTSLIESLQNMHSTTIEFLENKKKKLEELYNETIEMNNT
jgi:predicted patatin/cPLA2 family phospholipase